LKSEACITQRIENWNLRSDLLAECLARMDLVILLCNVLDALSNAHNSS